MCRALTAIVIAVLLGACGPGQRTIVLHDAEQPPDELSAWGVVFADGSRFTINPAALPYDLNTPLFSDYAQKLRTVWMPDGAAAVMSADGEIDFPVGTILSKTFYYETVAKPAAVLRVRRIERPGRPDDGRTLLLDGRLLVETRLLVRYADGWRAFPYVWDAAQDEAWLAVAGDVIDFELVDASGVTPFTYLVPDMNQCGACHTPDHGSGVLRPLGPQAWQLAREHAYADGIADQIDRWRARGFLAGEDQVTAGGANWWSPADATLEARARAYLDANCAHCHNPSGPADTSALNLDRESPLDRHFGICKTPVAVGRGSGDRPYDIYPGRPGDSILVYRMAHTDPAIAMPEIGRSVVHREAVTLVSAWIAAMNGEC